MRCGVWNQMKIWSSHLLDYCPASARIISSFDYWRELHTLMVFDCPSQDRCEKKFYWLTFYFSKISQQEVITLTLDLLNVNEVFLLFVSTVLFNTFVLNIFHDCSVITLTDFLAVILHLQKGGSSATAPSGTKWKVGDICQAVWSQDGR